MNYEILSTEQLEGLLLNARTDWQAAAISRELEKRRTENIDTGTGLLFEQSKAETLKTERLK
jgi:hypothetical protein